MPIDALLLPVISSRLDADSRSRALALRAVESLGDAPGSALSHSDGRRELLKVWESLGCLYGVRQHAREVVASRAALILALNALLLTDDPPPGVEMYVPVLDAELAALDWGLLGQVSPDRALQIEQIEGDWRASESEETDEVEGSISETPEGRLL
ncbi:hypothetical protein ACX80W_12975 [Arthrobacter sp. TMN-37]